MTSLSNLDKLQVGETIEINTMRRAVYDGNGMAHGEHARCTGTPGSNKYEWSQTPSQPMTQAMVDMFLKLKH